MLTSSGFLDYMRQGLSIYADQEKVSSICAYSPYPQGPELSETYFLPGADCWGWGTWPRAWKHFQPDALVLAEQLKQSNLKADFDLFGSQSNYKMLLDNISGKNDSWAIRWHASCFLRGMFYLCPRISLIENIGLDGSGTHCVKDSRWNPGPIASRVTIEARKVERDPAAIENARLFFQKVNQISVGKRMFNSIYSKTIGFWS